MPRVETRGSENEEESKQRCWIDLNIMRPYRYPWELNSMTWDWFVTAILIKIMIMMMVMIMMKMMMNMMMINMMMMMTILLLLLSLLLLL